jgi:hypothetical protein
MTASEVIVVGAGVAGLSCARELVAAGRRVLVLERARGVGGRLATRRLEGQPVDFGPLFLHGRDPAFLQAIGATPGGPFLEGWPYRVDGGGPPCQPEAFRRFERRVALPAGLSAFAKHLARGLEVRLTTTVATVRAADGALEAVTTDGERFAARDLVLALALEETTALLGELAGEPGVASARALLELFATLPCLTLIAGYDPSRTEEVAWDVCYPDDSERLQLIAHDSTKRPAARWRTLVLQGRPRWSRANLAAPAAAWRAELLGEAAARLGAWARHPAFTHAHVWRHARLDRGSELAAPLVVTLDGGGRLGLTGELFARGGGVQAAWLAGGALAARLTAATASGDLA